MGKKGISNIVTTVLIIFLSIAAISIITIFLIPMIRESISSETACNNLDLFIDVERGYTCYDPQTNLLTIQLYKGTNEINLSQVEIFLNRDENLSYYKSDVNFDPGSYRVFLLNTSELKEVKFISIIPNVITNNKNKKCSSLTLENIPLCDLGKPEEINIGAVVQPSVPNQGGTDPSNNQDKTTVPDGWIGIYSWEDLHNIRDNGDNQRYILMNDLSSLTEGYNTYAAKTANGGIGWIPIKGNGVNNLTLEGQNYTISDLYVNNPSGDYGGLFGVMKDISLSNIGMINATVLGKTYVGGFLGVLVKNRSGSLAALDGTAFLNNVYFKEGSVSCSSLCGGLMGTFWGTDLVLSNTYNSGNVSSSGETVGGLAGYINQNATALINNSYNTGKISGTQKIGGFIGQGYAGSAVTSVAIFDSFNNGTIIGSSTYVGGLIGYETGTYYNSFINNSYSLGNVSGSNYVGGLVGLSLGSVSNSYSTGKVTSSSSSKGGLIGTNSKGAITNSFYDTQTSGQSDTGKGEGKTTAEMKDIATYVGWDFDNIWIIDEGYPYLQWQNL